MTSFFCCRLHFYCRDQHYRRMPTAGEFVSLWPIFSIAKATTLLIKHRNEIFLCHKRIQLPTSSDVSVVIHC